MDRNTASYCVYSTGHVPLFHVFFSVKAFFSVALRDATVKWFVAKTTLRALTFTSPPRPPTPKALASMLSGFLILNFFGISR